MAKARLTRTARNELDEIWAFIARDSIDAAERVIEELSQTFRKLAEMPGMGATRDEFGPGIRSFPVGKYLIFYRGVPGGIQIVHIVHGARDLKRFFKDNP